MAALDDGTCRTGSFAISESFFGDFVPDDAANKDNVPGKIVVSHLGGSFEAHVGARVFCSYMAVQLCQGVNIGEGLELCVVRI